ncbi:hypothetical protein ACX3VT_05845 [Aerococcus sanguinicola]|nr:hypothetical protein F6I01_07520 [Aerococcus sanguinicola]MDK6233732.1 hypothetical protein [Aerococcus sp. UMB10185]
MMPSISVLQLACGDLSINDPLWLTAQAFVREWFKPGLLASPQSGDLVFKHSAAAFLAYRIFNQLLFPLRVDGGIGLASVTEDLSLDQERARSYAQTVLEQSQLFASSTVLYNADFLEDAIVNTQLLHWADLKAKQSEIQALLTLLYELHYPLYLAEDMQEEEHLVRGIQRIWQAKNKYLAQDEKLAAYQTLDLSAPKAVRYRDIHEELGRSHYYVTGFFKKGYAASIARIAQTSRQNIDYHLQNGRFAWERDTAAALVLQLAREEAAL